MSESVVFSLPLPLNIANGRLHWAEKNRRKLEYYKTLDFGVMGKKIPRPPTSPWTKARVDIEMFPSCELDHDNAEARMKWPLDWLVTRGYLAGDTPRHIERTGLIRQTLTNRKGTKVVLTVTPLEVAA